MNRTDFYFRQRVTEAEMDETIGYSEEADWNTVKEILGYGFLGTSPVISQQSPADLTVNLSALLGYDQLGRRLQIPSSAVPYNVNCAIDELAVSTVVAGVGNEKWLSLFIEFDRALSDPRTDGSGTTVYWEHAESFKINVVQAAEQAYGTDLKPVPRSDQVLIGDIRRIYGQTTFLTADIFQDRREDFTLTGFLHGASHREFGTDPAPNATPSDGGLMSAVDKTKLNTVTWTGPGVSTLLGRIGRAFQPTNISVPSATSVVVTTQMAAKTPGGGASQNGVVTTPTENVVPMFDGNGDAYLDTNGNKIYGRVTESGGVWTLSFFFNNPGVGETVYDMTPHSGGVIQWYCQEVFQLDSYPWADPMFAISSDQVAGTIPDATTSVKGKVQLATDGEVAALKVVQGDDSRLLASRAYSGILKLASRPSMIFMPSHTNPYASYRLHQMHGMARGDYQAPTPPDPALFYFEYDRGHVDYPISVILNGSPAQKGPNGSDNTDVNWAADQWYFVYAIGRAIGSPDKEMGMVVSTRAPWNNGPVLADTGGTSPFAFWNGGTALGSGSNYAGGWRYWKFVGCILNLSGSLWKLCQIRKIGNHCSYELAQLLYSSNYPNTPLTDVSLAFRVPHTALRANLRIYCYSPREAGSSTSHVKVRPSISGTMNLKETPSTLLSQDFMLQAGPIAGSGVNTHAGIAIDTGWVDTNTSRSVAYEHSAQGIPTVGNSGQLFVLGYEEFDDAENSEFTW